MSAASSPTTSGINNASLVNSFRISTTIDCLYRHVRSPLNSDPVEFSNFCVSLSKGIDISIANHEVPSRAQDLPPLVKQAWQFKTNTKKLAAIMVLMISIKNACQSGWFSDRDSNELRNLVKEIAKDFGRGSYFSEEPICTTAVISAIVSRFYPRMKMVHMFVSLEVKPGFDAYVSDFQISKKFKSSPPDEIRLLVVQTDSTETSSCLISPAKVNFLLNGKGVERRTSLFMDTGPQIPTTVTHLLKYGSNLFQAVGEFNGNYFIAVAMMSEMPNPDSNDLQDYEHLSPATVDPDSEVIEGPSRISLNCPISFRRIKTPVKGHSCKHIQCFDFDNYVDINSRRPSWRCPHCNQGVCFTNIRIDQNMVKVLKEVDPSSSSIIVSSDGSWNAVLENDAIQKPEDKTSDTGDGQPPQPVDLLDLTRADDETEIISTCEIEDIKIPRSACQNLSISQPMEVDPHIANTNNVNQSSNCIGDNFWSGIYFSALGQGSSNVLSNEHIPVSTSNNPAQPPVLTDSFRSNGEIEGFEAFYGNAPVTPSVLQRENCLLNTYQFENPNIINSYGHRQSIPGHITRIPIAVQALPAQTSTTVLQQRARNRINNSTQNGHSPAVQASPSLISNSTLGANTLQVPHMSSSSMHQYAGIQQQNNSFPNIQLPQWNIRPQDSNQVPNAPSILHQHQRSTQQMPNLSTPQAMSQSPSLAQPPMQQSATFLQPHSHLGVPQGQRTSHSYLMNHLDGLRMPSVGDHWSNVGVASQPLTRADAFDPAGLSWRPAGRMRGALSGQAYTDKYNEIFGQAQTARPI